MLGFCVFFQWLHLDENWRKSNWCLPGPYYPAQNPATLTRKSKKDLDKNKTNIKKHRNHFYPEYLSPSLWSCFLRFSKSFPRFFLVVFCRFPQPRTKKRRKTKTTTRKTKNKSMEKCYFFGSFPGCFWGFPQVFVGFSLVIPLTRLSVWMLSTCPWFAALPTPEKKHIKSVVFCVVVWSFYSFSYSCL